MRATSRPGMRGTKEPLTLSTVPLLGFVIRKPLEGLGSDLKTILRLCAEDAEALDSIDKATQRKRGNPTGINQHTSAGNPNNVMDSAPQGNERQQALRKLRKWIRLKDDS